MSLVNKIVAPFNPLSLVLASSSVGLIYFSSVLAYNKYIEAGSYCDDLSGYMLFCFEEFAICGVSSLVGVLGIVLAIAIAYARHNELENIERLTESFMAVQGKKEQRKDWLANLLRVKERKVQN